MPTHLYCLLPAGSEVAPPPADVRVLRADGGVVAWVADATSPALSRDAREVARATVEHDRVVSTALAQGVTPIPALLADPYASDSDALADVAAHGAGIDQALQSVRGMVEMTAIVAVNDVEPAEGPGRGRAFLEQIRSRPDRASAIADRLEIALRAIGGGARRRADGGRVALSFLIDRARVGDYRTQALEQAGEGYRIVIDGPRAPYSFASFAPRKGVDDAYSASRHESGGLVND